VTFPVVWTPEANEDLLEARAWYDNIRLELGERFPWRSRPRLMRLLSVHCSFLSSTGTVAVLECGDSRMAYSSSFRTIGLS